MFRGLPWWPWAKTLEFPMQGVPSSVPHQGTRSHMLQLRIHMPQLKNPHATMRSKILCAAAKTQHSQIKLFFLSVTGGFAGSSVVNSPPWMQGTLVWPLVQEDHTCCRANKLVHHNYWAIRCSYWSPGSQSPCLQQEKRQQWEACAPPPNVAPARHN